MSTATITGVEQIARNRLLTFAPTGGGPTLATQLGSTASGAGSDGKLYTDQAPDSVTTSGFWAVMRVIDFPQQGFDGGFLVRFTLELIIYGRPRSQASAVKRMAATAIEAWNGWLYSEVGGHVSATDVTSAFLIPYVSDPADRELVAFRLLLPGRCAPIFLTRYAA